MEDHLNFDKYFVLNLIINGIPSIPSFDEVGDKALCCFKPYYKWNTFNTVIVEFVGAMGRSFKPYYKWNTFNTHILFKTSLDLVVRVLNLIINGIPSIRYSRPLSINP